MTTARRGCCFSTQNRWLSRAERDDSTDRVIRGHANGDPVTRHYFDAEAAHAAAQLRQNLMARIALHAIQTARMNGHDRSLHIYEIVLAQSALPFARGAVGDSRLRRLARQHLLPARSAGDLATSVPYLVDTCNVMADRNLRIPSSGKIKCFWLLRDCERLVRRGRRAPRNRHL
jgi:hypothetical protein